MTTFKLQTEADDASPGGVFWAVLIIMIIASLALGGGCYHFLTYSPLPGFFCFIVSLLAGFGLFCLLTIAALGVAIVREKEYDDFGHPISNM